MRMRQFAPLVCLAVVASGCASLTPVQDWRSLPSDQAIQVQTKGGSTYSFERWESDGQGGILGMNKDYVRDGSRPVLKLSHVQPVPADSIAAVYALDTRASDTAKIATIAVGSVAIVATVWLIFDFLYHHQFIGRIG